MPHSSMCMPTGWNGLSMPTEGCFVCIPMVIIIFKLRDVEQDSVPFMMRVIHTHIPIECLVVYSYVYRFLNGSG